MNDPLNYAKVRVIVTAGAKAKPLITLGIMLAASAKTKIVVEYQRDRALEDIATLPFTRAVHQETAETINIDADSMSIAINREIEQCRLSLSDLAVSQNVQWAFDVVTDFQSAEQAVDEKELLVIPRDPYAAHSNRHLGLLETAASKKQAVLIDPVGRARPDFRNIAVVISEVEQDLHLLKLAQLLASQSGSKISVFSETVSPALLSRLATEFTDEKFKSVDFHVFGAEYNDTRSLTLALNQLNPAITLISRQSDEANATGSLLDLIQRVRSPVLVVFK